MSLRFHLIAAHCLEPGRCLLQKECQEFPLSFMSDHLAWAWPVPGEPSGHSWSRVGLTQIAELGAWAPPVLLEGHGGAGLTNVNEYQVGWVMGPSPRSQWEETGKGKRHSVLESWDQTSVLCSAPWDSSRVKQSFLLGGPGLRAGSEDFDVIYLHGVCVVCEATLYSEIGSLRSFSLLISLASQTPVSCLLS